MSVETPVLQDPEPATIRQHEAVDPYFLLGQLAASTTELADLCRSALYTVAEYLQAVFAVIQVEDGGELVEQRFVRRGDEHAWKRFADEVIVESREAAEVIARVYVDDGGNKVAVLSAPLRAEQGALAVVLPFDSQQAMERDLWELRSLATVIGVFTSRVAPREEVEPPSVGYLQRALRKAAETSSVPELAFAIANGAKNEFRCQQAALSLVNGNRVRLLSISGMESVNPRSPGAKAITQAMEECLDRQKITCSQPQDRWADGGELMDGKLHRQWRNSVGNVCVASIPLLQGQECVGQKCVGIVSLSRPGHEPFGKEQLERFEDVLSDYAPALTLSARANRSLAVHLKDQLACCWSWLFTPEMWGRRIAAGLLLAFFAWACWGSWSYRVSVPFVVTPTRVIHFAAPFEGALAVAEVAQGDRVSAGQLLFEMDTTDLKLKRYELEAELEVARLEAAQYLDQQDYQSSAAATAKIRVIQAYLATLRQQLEQARIEAPEDGVILSGEIQRRVGEVVPLGEPLLEFSPSRSWSIELEIPEHVVSHLRGGLPGTFVATARPEESQQFSVDSIQPIAEPRNGQNVFVASAHVEENPAWMRAGMSGVATVDVGPRRVSWILFHRVVNYLHLHLSR